MVFPLPLGRPSRDELIFWNEFLQNSGELVYFSVIGHSNEALDHYDDIEDYVVSKAKAMLSLTACSIQEISYELNFPSQSVFGKYFKRVTGR